MTTLTEHATDLRVRQGSKNWHAARMTGIGASEIGAVLGVSPYMSATKLYHVKRGTMSDNVETTRMNWGKRLERVVLDRWLADHPEHRHDTFVRGRCYRSNERDWQMASPDTLVVDKAGDVIVLEAKTANRPGHDDDEDHLRWGPDGSDDIPTFYRCQALQIADVVGADRWYVPVLFGGSDFRCYTGRVDPDEVAILRAKGAKFWRDVQAGVEPRADDHRATSETMRALYGLIEEDAYVDRDLVEKLDRAKVLLKRIEAYHSTLENRLRQDMGGSARAFVDGVSRPVATRSGWEQNDFRRAEFRADYPDLYDWYCKPSPRQRFTFRGLPHEEK